jgi:hypothetical protein
MTASLEVKFGRLKLRTLGLVPPEGSAPVKVAAMLGGQPVPATLEMESGKARIGFGEPLTMLAGDSLSVSL